ncbi:MAG TPA: globin domain-containing protein [Gemmatimonadales bacterium]|nr:globin domain-containing protein [Gemmatimonadales bacterium]
MNPDAIVLIRDGWARIGPIESPKLADAFYQYLWSVDEETRRIFSHPEAGLLHEKFLSRLSLVVSALDEPELLVPLLAHLGARHHEAGLGDRQYVLMGEALLYALRATLGEYWNSAVHLAWAESYTFIASIMKRAGVRASGAQPIITE